jgi:DNA-binding NtrC family response regulator
LGDVYGSPHFSPTTPLKILVLHQDPDRREELAAALRASQDQTVVAQSPADAAAMLDPSVDAILLDLRVPGLDPSLLREALVPGQAIEPESLDTVERRHVSLVLRHTGGNKRRAALILGISRSTLLNKVRKYQLEEP